MKLRKSPFTKRGRGASLLQLNKEEKGSVLIESLAGSMLVMLFIVSMLLLFAGYMKVVRAYLAIDNIAKEYLYQMEQYGYLSNDMKSFMESDLADIGATKVVITPSHDESKQAAYGQRVTLEVNVAFKNPIYDMFDIEVNEGEMFAVMDIPNEITYSVSKSATAKW